MPTAVVIASCALVLVFQKYREMLNTWSNVQSMPQPFHSTCKYTVYTIRFADDIKTFRLIMNRDDQNIVQQDITVIETLSENWMLKLHPDECTHMDIEKKEFR